MNLVLFYKRIPALVPGKYNVLEHKTDLAHKYYSLEIYKPGIR